MNISYLEIVSFVLAGVGVGGTFVPRFPSGVAAYLSMICMAFAGIPYFDAKVLIFWGVATVIVLGLEILPPRARIRCRRHCGGSIVGLPCLADGVGYNPWLGHGCFFRNNGIHAHTQGASFCCRFI